MPGVSVWVVSDQCSGSEARGREIYWVVPSIGVYVAPEEVGLITFHVG
jgi:hypothetical protein